MLHILARPSVVNPLALEIIWQKVGDWWVLKVRFRFNTSQLHVTSVEATIWAKCGGGQEVGNICMFSLDVVLSSDLGGLTKRTILLPSLWSLNSSMVRLIVDKC